MLLGSRTRRPIPGGLSDPSQLQDVGDIALPGIPDFNGPRVVDKRTGKAEWTDTGFKGALQRAGDFLGSDQGRGALLRSAAATFDGGLGKGLAAGAAYIDGQKELDQRAEQRQFDNDLSMRGADLNELRAQQQNDLGWAGVETTMRGQTEAQRHNMASEQLGVRGQNVDIRGQDINRANNQDQTGLGYARIQEDGRQADMGSADRRYATDKGFASSIYGDNLQFLGVGERGAAGIGSKAFTETVTKNPARTEGGFMGFGGTSVPATETTTRIPMALPPAVAPAAGASPPPDAVQLLKSNPNLAAQFEAKYGAGSAAQYLGGR